jgi:ribonuclease-3
VRAFLARFRTPPERGAATPEETHLLKNLGAFERTIGYAIRDRRLFVQALLHRSFLQRPNQSTRSNERLEFLGDSVLNLIVGEYLYHHYPKAEEGELTQVRSRLVNRTALAAYARALRLADFILMSPSAAQSGRKGSDTITADTFEAVIAAIYLDGGFQAAREFVERNLESGLKKGVVRTADDNYKSALLEHAQSHGHGVPRYVVVHEEGPDHDRTFTVDVSLSSGLKGTGTGKNKKEAEQAAARQALRALQQH